tara:strand:- start:235 stop:639 length:405 start_codon:yes stop_codon:yes gene_type:complete
LRGNINEVGKRGDSMNDLIKKKVLSRNWSFNEIADLKKTIEGIATDIYEEMKLMEKFDLIREIRIKETYIGEVFEDVMKQHVYIVLRAEVADTVRNMLNNATVNFGDKNEVSERSMGGESHKERPSDEKENSEN